MSSITKIPTHNLNWFSFLPRIVRMCVFKFGILSLSTIYERFFLNRFHNHFQHTGWFGFSQDYDDARCQKTVAALKSLGAEEATLTPQDGEASLQALTLKASAVKRKIEEHGGSWKKEGTRIVIRGPQTQEWKVFYETVLKKIFYNEEADGEDRILVTSKNAEEISFFPSFFRNKIECVLLSRFAKSFVMNKRDIAYFLGKGLDVALYDGRGILNSTGYPSEGGSYFDIEAVGTHLFKTQGYDPSRTCIFGSCGESLTAMHLFKKYCDQGVHLLARNPLKSLDDVTSRINPIASWIFGWNKGYFRAPEGSQCKTAPENGYDSLAKIREIDRCRGSSVLLLSTTGDKVSPPDEVEEMGRKLNKKGANVVVMEGGLEDSAKHKRSNDSHEADPLRNPKMQKAIHKLLFG